MNLLSSLGLIGQVLVDDRASVAIEYGLLVALVGAVLLITLMAGIGNALVSIFEQTAEGLNVAGEEATAEN
jgi:Flp pilus assembly pilin Flp